MRHAFPTSCSWPALAISLALGCTPALADDDWVGGFVVMDAGKLGVRTGRLNPDNFFRIPRTSADLSEVVEGAFDQVTFRARAEQVKSFGALGGTSRSATLLELNRVFAVGENQTISIGKRLFSLDQSFIGLPLGFFQKQVDLNDPTDSAGRAEGLPMAVYSWSDEKRTVNFIYSNDFAAERDGFNRGIQQGVIRLAYEYNNVSVSVLTRKASGESVGIGGSFSATCSDNLGLYGSFYTARGTLWPVLPALYELGAAPGRVNAAGLASLRADDGKAYPRAAAGVVFTPKDLPKLQLELIYDRRGLSDDDYRRLLSLIDTHRALALQGDPRAYDNLGTDANVFLARGARRKYISLNVDHLIGDVTLGGGAYWSVADRSATYYGSISRYFSPRLVTTLSMTAITGARNAERELSPVARSVDVRLKYIF